MIRAITVDDEWYNLEEISDLVNDTGLIRVVKKYQNPRHALEDFETLSPEVAFIDIELGEMDGITLAKQLLEINPELIVVFITSWDKYAINAFDVEATDYILKPIRIERFNKMIDKIIKKMNIYQENVAKIKIKLFDKFEVKINDNHIKWQRAKSEELFAFLLLNCGRYIHKDIILDNLWNDYEPDKALHILQTTIYRIRKIFEDYPQAVSIEYCQNSYKLEVNGIWCDYLELEKSMQSYSIQEKNSYQAVEKSAMEFTKGLLTQNGFLWSEQKDEEIRKKLVIILEEIASSYHFNEKTNDYIRNLTLISTLHPYEDEINYQLIKELKVSGDNIKALKHYKWLEKTLRKEYGLIPTKKIRDLIEG